MLYRFVTFKKNKDHSGWYINHIGYSSRLTYDIKTTNIEPNELYSNYIITIDKGYNIVDKFGKIIYDNDLIKTSKNQIFLVKRKNNRKTPTFINVKNSLIRHSILYFDKVDWEIIGNIYNTNMFNFNTLN